MKLISVMLDSSHPPIGPCEALEESPLEGSSMQAWTALLSSVSEAGENADTESGDHANMPPLFTFE